MSKIGAYEANTPPQKRLCDFSQRGYVLDFIDITADYQTTSPLLSESAFRYSGGFISIRLKTSSSSGYCGSKISYQVLHNVDFSLYNVHVVYKTFLANFYICQTWSLFVCRYIFHNSTFQV